MRAAEVPERWREDRRGGVPFATVAALLLVWTCQVGASGGSEDGAGAALQDFYLAAIAHNPRLGIAAENLNIHAARNASAGGQLLPQVSITGNLTENRREALGRLDEFRGERYSLQVSQVLFDWGAFAARRRAQRLEAMQEAEYQSEQSFLIVEVADRYLSVLQGQDALESIRAEVDAVASQVDRIQGLFDRQLAPITDLRQAQASLAAARAEQVRLRSDLDLARERLQAVSGLGIGELYTLRHDGKVPRLETDVAHWVGLGLEHNQRLESGRLGIEAAREGIAQARGQAMPRLSLLVQRQNSNVGFDNAPIQRTDISFIGIDLSMPLFSGGRDWAVLREARSAHALAKREQQLAELEASERVRGAYLQLSYSESHIDAARALVEAATVSAEALRQAFALGTVTHVDVLRSIRDRFQAERDLYEARYDSIRYFLLLRHEAGTLTPEDLLVVSSWFEPRS